MTVTLTTGDGALRMGIPPTRVTVRSAVFSGIGAALTVGALLFLALWWGNHFRRTRRAARPRREHQDRERRHLVSPGPRSPRSSNPSVVRGSPRPLERGRRARHAALARHRTVARRRARLRARPGDARRHLQPREHDAEHRLRAAHRRRAVRDARPGLRRPPRNAATTAATSAVFTVTLTVLVGLTAVAMLFAPLIARLYSLDATGAERAAQLDVMTLLIRCFLPQMFFYGFTALAAARAQRAPALRRRRVRARAQQRRRRSCVLLAFSAARRPDRRTSWIDVARIQRRPRACSLLLGLGTTAGIAAMALVLVPAARRAGRAPPARLRLAPRGRAAGHPSVGLDRRLRRSRTRSRCCSCSCSPRPATTGDVSAYQYAFIFFQLPHGLFAVSIMTTMTPELARHATARRRRRACATTSRSACATSLLVVVPSAVGARGARATGGRGPRARRLRRARRGRHRRHAAGVRARARRRSRSTSSRCAASTRCQDTRTPFLVNVVRERRQHRARARAVPVARRAGPRARRTRARTRSPRSSRSSLLAAPRSATCSPPRGARPRRGRARSAPLALGVVAALARRRDRPRLDHGARPRPPSSSARLAGGVGVRRGARAAAVRRAPRPAARASGRGAGAAGRQTCNHGRAPEHRSTHRLRARGGPMAVRIVTDSASDLPQDVCDELGIEVVPAHDPLRRRGVRRPQGAEHRRRSGASSRRRRVLPETAAPSVGAFEETFRRLADDGADGIVCINLSAQLSATMQSAQVAAKALDGLCPVAIIDSKSASMGIGNLVHARGAPARRDGADLDDDRRARSRTRRDRQHVLATLDTLEYLRKGGRIGGAQAHARLDAVDQADHHGDRRRGRAGRQGPHPHEGAAVHRRPGPERQRRDASRCCTPARPTSTSSSSMLRSRSCRDAEIVVGHIGPVVGVHTGPARARRRLDRARADREPVPLRRWTRADDAASRRRTGRGRGAAATAARSTRCSRATSIASTRSAAASSATTRTRSTRRRRR